MEKLNSFEKAILEEVISFNEKEYPHFREHLKYIRVKSREFTGVGEYIYLSYLPSTPGNIFLEYDDTYLCSDNYLYIQGIKYPVTYAPSVSKGKIDMIEVVTIAENWDGTVTSFKFINPKDYYEYFAP